MPDISKIVLPDNTKYEIKDTKARMIILSYGHSTWTDFITAYQNNQVIYCRASSNSNPATGSQTRLAFMAYVSNAETPTNVEFQYYRSMSKHTDAQQGDQVFVYKLTNANKWTVTVRNAFSKVIAGDNLTSSFVESETTSSITLDADYDTEVTEDSTKLITSGAVADALSSKADTADLAQVATSGDYSDLINTPTIPVVDTQLDPNSNNAIANSVVAAVRDLIYPVGSIYMSVTDSTVASVEARFGGTWERIAEGETLFGYKSGDTDFGTVGDEGGNKDIDLSHSHTVNSHSHTIDNQSGYTGSVTLTANQSGVQAHGHGFTQPTVNKGKVSGGITGGGHTHNFSTYIQNAADEAHGYTLVGGGGFYDRCIVTSSVNRIYATSNTHTHDLPDHSHTVSGGKVSDHSGTSAKEGHKHSLPKSTGTNNPGTDSKLSTTQNILNPYITVYMYKRTA